MCSRRVASPVRPSSLAWRSAAFEDGQAGDTFLDRAVEIPLEQQRLLAVAMAAE
jgi:hypothetical protein